MSAMKVIIRSSTKLFVLLVLIIALTLSSTGISIAMSEAQRRIFMQGIPYFNIDLDDGGCGSSVDVAGMLASLRAIHPIVDPDPEIVAFAVAPLDATFGISDDVIEAWYMERLNNNPNLRRVRDRYGLNPAVLRQVSAIVREAGVSPVAFYLVSNIEGGGHAGFLNHFPVGAFGTDPLIIARAEAERWVEVANDIGTEPPALVDLGQPNHGVIRPVHAFDAANNTNIVGLSTEHFKNNWPPGTMGGGRIAMAAAAAWEIYFQPALQPGGPYGNGWQGYSHMGGFAAQIRELGGNFDIGGGGGLCPGSSVGHGDIMAAAEYMYNLGGGPGGACFDCVAFVNAVYYKAFGDTGKLPFAPHYYLAGVAPRHTSSVTGGIANYSPRGETLGFNAAYFELANTAVPGDIVVWRGHVGIYAGSPRIIEGGGDDGRGFQPQRTARSGGVCQDTSSPWFGPINGPQFMTFLRFKGGN